jgi:hypothetical protein
MMLGVSQSVQGGVAILMLSIALCNLYRIFPIVALVLGVLFVPLGIAALVVTILTELRYAPKHSGKAGDGIQPEREPRSTVD